jgi:hypothetical protein
MYDRSEYAAFQIFPVIPVPKAEGTFGLIPMEEMLRDTGDLRRQTGGGYKRSTFKFKEASYKCEERGHEELIDDRERRMYVDFIQADTIAVERAVHELGTDAEKRAAALFPNAASATYDPAGALGSTASASWADGGAASTPRRDVTTAIHAMYDLTGLWANTLVISRKLFHELRLNTDITDQIASQGAGDQVRAEDVTVSQLEQVFALDKVIVAGGTKLTPAASQTAALTAEQIWDQNKAIVCRTAMTGDFREPCIGRVFHWAEDGSSLTGTVETYREESKRSDVYRVRHDIDEARLYDEAAHVIAGVMP